MPVAPSRMAVSLFRPTDMSMVSVWTMEKKPVYLIMCLYPAGVVFCCGVLCVCCSFIVLCFAKIA